MQIVKTEKEQYRMTLTAAEARIFISGMNETIKELGSEFQTRMGAEIYQVREVVAALEAALK
jgi:hypothetical protein